MNRLLFLLFLLLLCPAAEGQAEIEDTAGPSDPAEIESFIDGAIEALMRSHKVPGATVSVVKDGAVLFAKGYGYANVDRRIRVDPERTMFRIASVSKLFAWTALMQLAEKGDVDLEEDVNSYLDFEIPPTFPEPITSKHLLTHTAGFEDRYRGLFGAHFDSPSRPSWNRTWRLATPTVTAPSKAKSSSTTLWFELLAATSTSF